MGKAVIDIIIYILKESKQYIFNSSVYKAEVTLSFYIAFALFTLFT